MTLCPKTHLKHQYNRKSMKLENMYPILNFKNCQFVNIQYGDVKSELKNFMYVSETKSSAS